MDITIRPYLPEDLPGMINLWNAVVETGESFPHEEKLDTQSGSQLFKSQTLSAVAARDGEIVGLYVLHPNNIGRCGHIANAAYAVKSSSRGLGIGRRLVVHSIAEAKTNGFRILQFNAVLATNIVAIQLYKKLGFTQLGLIEGGFRSPSGEYIDIIPHYIKLVEKSP